MRLVEDGAALDTIEAARHMGIVAAENVVNGLDGVPDLN
jgi:hypothetical protein